MKISQSKRQKEGEILGGELFSTASQLTSYRFRLYVAGKNRKSKQAIETLDKLSAFFPKGRFSAEIIDIHERADLAKKDDVLAVPALLKLHPPPPTTFIGATSDHFAILRRLGIPVEPAVMARFKAASQS